MGLVVAGQELKVVGGQVDDDCHSSDNSGNEISLQDVVASKRE